jgi:hypothetical protein
MQIYNNNNTLKWLSRANKLNSDSGFYRKTLAEKQILNQRTKTLKKKSFAAIVVLAAQCFYWYLNQNIIAELI